MPLGTLVCPCCCLRTSDQQAYNRIDEGLPEPQPEPEPKPPHVYDSDRPTLDVVAEREVLLHICSFLTAQDLGRVARVSRSFGGLPRLAAADTEASGGIALLSIVEEAARRWLLQCSEQERGWVPRRGEESRLGLMREVELLRCAAVFGRFHQNIVLSEGGARATMSKKNADFACSTAASKAVMRAGVHYAQFTVVQGHQYGDQMFFGVIRASWDVEEGVNAYSAGGHCFYYTANGEWCPGPFFRGSYYEGDWEGMQTAGLGDRIGVLLDLDQGSMVVFKNDERLGVMVASGLSGEFCWAAALRFEGTAARIEPTVLPDAPAQ